MVICSQKLTVLSLRKQPRAPGNSGLACSDFFLYRVRVEYYKVSN